jgi:hypothetical protein
MKHRPWFPGSTRVGDVALIVRQTEFEIWRVTLRDQNGVGAPRTDKCCTVPRRLPSPSFVILYPRARAVHHSYDSTCTTTGYRQSRTHLLPLHYNVSWCGCQCAALLMFDINQPATLHALIRWWSEFRTCAPLADEGMEEYCLVIVGNKTATFPIRITLEEDALHLIGELDPPSDTRSTSRSPAPPAA